MLIILVMWNQIVSSFGNRFKSIQKFVKSCYHQAVLEEMLSKNDDTDFNQIDQAGWFPLHRAIVLANIAIVKKLLKLSNVLERLNPTNKKWLGPFFFHS